MSEQVSFFPDPDQDPVIDTDEIAARIAGNSRYAGSPDRTSEASIDQGHGIQPDFPVEIEAVQDDSSNVDERVDYNSPKERAKLRKVAEQAILQERLDKKPLLDRSNLKIGLTLRDDGTGRSDDSKRRQWEIDRASQREQARKERG